MRVDCINQCLGDGPKKTNENCTSPFYHYLILWRNDSSYSSSKDSKLCEDDWNALGEIMDEREKVRTICEVKCRPNCVNRYYKKLIKMYETPDYVMPVNMTEIFFGHNNMPDQITQHIEEMTFVDFSGTFGGLVGVWLGFSIATVISHVLDIISNKFLKNFNMPI